MSAVSGVNFSISMKIILMFQIFFGFAMVISLSGCSRSDEPDHIGKLKHIASSALVPFYRHYQAYGAWPVSLSEVERLGSDVLDEVRWGRILIVVDPEKNVRGMAVLLTLHSENRFFIHDLRGEDRWVEIQKADIDEAIGGRVRIMP